MPFLRTVKEQDLCPHKNCSACFAKIKTFCCLAQVIMFCTGTSKLPNNNIVGTVCFIDHIIIYPSIILTKSNYQNSTLHQVYLPRCIFYPKSESSVIPPFSPPLSSSLFLPTSFSTSLSTSHSLPFSRYASFFPLFRYFPSPPLTPLPFLLTPLFFPYPSLSPSLLFLLLPSPFMVFPTFPFLRLPPSPPPLSSPLHPPSLSLSLPLAYRLGTLTWPAYIAPCPPLLCMLVWCA